MFPGDPDIDLGVKRDHGQCMEGGKQIVVLCVSRFPRDLRSFSSSFCCGRSKQQGCVLRKNDGTKRSLDFLHICGASCSSCCRCNCKEQQSGVSHCGFFQAFWHFSTIFSSLLFQNSLGQQLQRSFPHKQELCALVNNRGPGKSDNNAVAVCDGQSV